MNQGTGPYGPWCRHLAPLLFLLCLLIGGLWAWCENPAQTLTDVDQQSLDYATAPLEPGQTLSQTFISHHDGLSAIQLRVARYLRDEPLPTDAQLTLHLAPNDSSDRAARTLSVNVSHLEHNQWLRLNFAPIADSADRTYRLTLRANRHYELGLWASESDALAGGTLSLDDETRGGDLAFTTQYRYDLHHMLADAARLLGGNLRSLVILALILLVPGSTLRLCLLPHVSEDAVSNLGMAITLSLAFWPLLWLWATALGIRLTARRLTILLGILAALLLWGWIRRPQPRPQSRSRRRAKPVGTGEAALTLAVLMAFTVLTRLLQMRNLVVPPWVDSLHHSIITDLLASQGRIPVSLAPYVEGATLHYHVGFHSVAASHASLGDLAAPDAVLWLGQALNVLTLLSGYLLARWVAPPGARRWAGVVGAGVAALGLSLPAYLLSWGRFTQLAGLLMLPAAMLLTDRLLRSGSKHPAHWLVTATLVAGLALTHYRVLIFYALFCLLRLFFAARTPRLHKALFYLSILSILCIFSLMPWLVRFWRQVRPAFGTAYGGWAAPTGFDNAFPRSFFTETQARVLLFLAAATLAASLLAAIFQGRRRALLLGVWSGLCLLLANLNLLGLPNVWLISNTSVVIAAWLPLAALVGGGLGQLLRRLRGISLRIHPVLQPVSELLLILALVGWAAWRSWGMIDVVNPITVLVTKEDLPAVRWVQENTPPSARFLINSRPWQGELRMGSDAGWWLPLLADREVSLPCVLYAQASREVVAQTNRLAALVESRSELEGGVNDAAFLAQLQETGIDHVFVGNRGGPLPTEELDASPYYVLEYAYGPVRIYRLQVGNGGRQKDHQGFLLNLESLAASCS